MSEKTNEQKQVGYLKALKRAYAWKILEEEFMDRVKDIESEVLNNFTPEYNDKVYSKNDLLKVERKLLQQFIYLPDNLIKALDIIEEDDKENEEDAI